MEGSICLGTKLDSLRGQAGGCIGGTHASEELADLGLRSICKLNFHIHSTRANEGFVELVRKVCSDSEDSAFVRCNAIDGVQQSLEREMP